MHQQNLSVKIISKIHQKILAFVQIFKPYMSSTAQSHPLLLFLLDVSSLSSPLCASVIFGYFVSEENLINFSMQSISLQLWSLNQWTLLVQSRDAFFFSSAPNFTWSIIIENEQILFHEQLNLQNQIILVSSLKHQEYIYQMFLGLS